MKQIEYKHLQHDDFFATYYSPNEPYKAVSIHQRRFDEYNTAYLLYNSSKTFTGNMGYSEYNRSCECNFRNIKKEVIYFKLDPDEFYDIIANLI